MYSYPPYLNRFPGFFFFKIISKKLPVLFASAAFLKISFF